MTTAAADRRARHVSIVAKTTDIAAGADRHDWVRVRSALSDEVTTDYTSLFGGDSTHHMVANHAVTGAGVQPATAEADFTATHRIGDALWVLGGRYRYRLRKAGADWMVTSITMQPDMALSRWVPRDGRGGRRPTKRDDGRAAGRSIRNFT